jgi:hypothetical protein
MIIFFSHLAQMGPGKMVKDIWEHVTEYSLDPPISLNFEAAWKEKVTKGTEKLVNEWNHSEAGSLFPLFLAVSEVDPKGDANCRSVESISEAVVKDFHARGREDWNLEVKQSK